MKHLYRLVFGAAIAAFCALAVQPVLAQTQVFTNGGATVYGGGGPGPFMQTMGDCAWWNGYVEGAPNSSWQNYDLDPMRGDAGQNYAMCPDGSGGAIMTWVADLAGTNCENCQGYNKVFAQRINSSGNAVWTTSYSGIANSGLCVDGSGSSESGCESSYGASECIGDGNGGAYITWGDYNYEEQRIQHVNASGSLVWGSSCGSAGYDLTQSGHYCYEACVTQDGAPNVYDDPFLVNMASDPSGGILVAWFDSPTNCDVYQNGTLHAAKITGDNGSSPKFGWSGSTVTVGTISSPSNELYPSVGFIYNQSPVICTDGNGGAYIADEMYDQNGGSDANGYNYEEIWHVNSSGTVVASVKIPCNPTYCHNYSNLCKYNDADDPGVGGAGYSIVPDGSGGAILGYCPEYDPSVAGTGQYQYYSNIWAVRVNSSLGTVWGPKNVVQTTASGSYPYWYISGVRFAPDDAGGLYVSYCPLNGGPTGANGMMVQHVNSSGTILWNPTGMSSSTYPGYYASGTSLPISEGESYGYWCDGGEICSDKTGSGTTPSNVICSWTTSSYITYMQAFSGTSTSSPPTQIYGASPIQVSASSYNAFNQYVQPDGSGGVFVGIASWGQGSYEAPGEGGNLYVQYYQDTAAAAHCSVAGSPVASGNVRVNKTGSATGLSIKNFIGSAPSVQGKLVVAGTNSTPVQGNATASISSPVLPFSVAVGSSQTFTASVTPLATGNFTTTLTLNNNSVNLPQANYTVTGTGTFPHFSSANQWIYGKNVDVGTSYSQQFTITNSATDTLHITGVSVLPGSGINSPVDISMFTPVGAPTVANPLKIAAGASANVTIAFNPQSNGPHGCQLVILADDSQYVAASAHHYIPITGFGVSPHLVANSTMNFPPTVAVLRHTTQAWAVTNSGTDTLFISSTSNFTGAYPSAYQFASHLPDTIPPGTTGSVLVNFTPPSISGPTFTATMNIVSNFDSVYINGVLNPNAPFPVALSGIGVDSAADFVYSSVISPASLHSGSVRNGNDTNITPVIFTNLGGSNGATRRLLINQININGAFANDYYLLHYNWTTKKYVNVSGVYPDTLYIGQSDTFYLVFFASQSGYLPANLQVYATLFGTTSSEIDIPIIATGLHSQISASALAFGSVGTNACDTLTLALSNTGTAATTISSFNLIGDAASYTVLNQNVQGSNIGIGQTLYIHVVFCPATTGEQDLTARFIDSDGDTVNATITGAGVNPGDLVYNNLVFPIPTALNQPIKQNLNITNTGQASVTITSAELTGVSPIGFFESTTFPQTVGGGKVLSIPVTFSPAIGGTQVDTMVMQTSAGKIAVTFTGTGATAPFVYQPSNALVFNEFAAGTFNPNGSFDSSTYIENFSNSSATLKNQQITGDGASAFSLVYPLAWPVNIASKSLDSIVVEFQPVQPDHDYFATLIINAVYGGTVDTTIRIALNGIENTATETKESDELPLSISLEQNYPNPFGTTTQIGYSIPEQSMVTLAVYDELGREVRELVSGAHAPGTYSVSFEAQSLPAGVYYYRLTAGSYTTQRIMNVVR